MSIFRGRHAEFINVESTQQKNKYITLESRIHIVLSTLIQRNLSITETREVFFFCRQVRSTTSMKPKTVKVLL